MVKKHAQKKKQKKPTQKRVQKDVFSLFVPEVRGLIKKRFESPTPIQESVIPKVLEGRNILMMSETGSGKTEAVMLPIFNRLVKNPKKTPKPISIIYICPLRSLNRDLLKRILWWSKELGFDVSVRHGDTSQYERYMQSQNPSDMLIVTPETLQAILTGKLMRAHLANVRWIVIDELHELCSNKRGVQLSVGLERLKELIASEGNVTPQLIGLSATIGSPEKVARFLSPGSPCDIVNTEKRRGFDVIVESPNPSKRDFSMASKIWVSPVIAARLARIEQMLSEKTSVLTFTNTREFAEILSSRLKAMEAGIPIETHHSSLSKDVRIDAEERFKDGKLKSLICTSSLELGIDIGSIDFVIQYQSPRQVAKFIQRIGRSGHSLTKRSSGLIVSSDPEDCFESTVIAEHALRGLIEPTIVYPKSLDVLGHQIIGLAIEEYNIPMDRAFRIIKRAEPFRSVTKQEFLSVCEFLQRLGLIWIDTFSGDPLLKRRKRAWEYYYQNLSTIPDVKNYKIIDTVSNKHVANLDAEFIALHGSPNTSFICKGQAWRILELREGKVFVEPSKGVEASIPAWEGELIPVPWDVAQGVGALRREIKEHLRSKAKKENSKENIIRFLTRKYPITKNTAEKLFALVEIQSRKGIVPDDRTILIEYGETKSTEQRGYGTRYFYPTRDYWVVIHACWGSLVNETVGRALTAILTNRFGSVGLQTNPYKIILKMQSGQHFKESIELFKNLDPQMLPDIVKLSLRNSEVFRWRFLHVAKRFGIIDRGADYGGSYGKGYLKKVVESYLNTPACNEALNEIEQEKLDIEKAVKAMELVQSKKIRIEVKRGLSPLSEAGVLRRYEVVAPERPEKEIFEVFRQRLMGTRMRLLCCHCGFAINYDMKDLPKDIKCQNCGARLVGVIKPYDTNKEKLMKKFIDKKPLAKEELEIVNEIMDTASMVASSGPSAVIAMAGRGVGPSTAARILLRQGTGDDLLKDVLKAEQTFSRTKRFWKE